MSKSILQLETLSCPSCVAKIEAALNRIDGVKEVKVGFNSSKVTVSYDDTIEDKTIFKDAVSKLGYDVLSQK